MVSQIGQLLSGKSSLQETLQQLQANEKSSLEQQAAPAAAPKAASDTLSLSSEAKSLSGSSMMARNFAGGRESDSTYIDAQMAGLRASKEMSLSQDKTMTSVLDAFGGISGPSMYDPHDNKKTGGGSASEHDIREYLDRQAAKKVMEDKQEELRREKEAQRAAEAQALATGDMAAAEPGETGAAAGSAQTAPRLDISGSSPAPALAAPVAASPAPAAAAAPVPAASTSPAPATPTVDVTV